MIHLAQQKPLKVHQIAGNLERHDLPPAVAQELVAEGEAIQDHLAVAGTVAFGNDVLVCPDLVNSLDQRGQSSLLIRR